MYRRVLLLVVSLLVLLPAGALARAGSGSSGFSGHSPSFGGGGFGSRARGFGSGHHFFFLGGGGGGGGSVLLIIIVIVVVVFLMSHRGGRSRGRRGF